MKKHPKLTIAFSAIVLWIFIFITSADSETGAAIGVIAGIILLLILLAISFASLVEWITKKA